MAAKINNKEITLRQWFAARYGNVFENYVEWKLPKGIAEINRDYTRENPNLPCSFNFIMYKLREMEIEVRTTGTFKLYDDVMQTEYLDTENYVRTESETSNEPGNTIARTVTAPIEVKLNVQKLDDMEFPVFRDFPTDTIIDKIFSDDDELKGPMSGMVIICTGESGVGKSTLLIDVLSKIKNFSETRVEAGLLDKPVEPLYISTEMTKTDIYFYKKKMPAIGKVNTILVSEYLKHGLKEAITKAFQSTEYDVILLDSYQDLVEKMQDILNWRAKEAENFLIQLMVEAAENLGKCIIAIQHLSKGGEYIGRTFLKHTTTAMLELKFDKTGDRFAMFSKNRRAGSMTHIPVYFTLKNSEVAFDVEKFESLVNATEISKSVSERQAAITANIGSIFNIAGKAMTDDEAVERLTLEDE